MRRLWVTPAKLYSVLLGVVVALSALFGMYTFVYSDKTLPHVSIAAVDVSGMTQKEAAAKLRERFEVFFREGIKVVIEGNEEIIDPDNIDLTLPAETLAEHAWSFGRRGSWLEQLRARITAPFSMRVLSARIEVNEEKLASEIAILAQAYDIPRKDIRFDIRGTKVRILYDTKPGRILNRTKTKEAILSRLGNLDLSPVALTLEVDNFFVDPESGDSAKGKVEAVISNPIILSYQDQEFRIEREMIGSWIVSRYERNRLVPALDTKLLSEYVVSVAEQIDIPPQNPTVKVEDRKVVEFVVPKHGRALVQNDAIDLIVKTLEDRISGEGTMKELSLPVVVKKPTSEGSAADLGIVELIGTATTPFTGSPKNRIHNIKNGVRFLSGILIPPGEEFSTLESLGSIDNTTGYLPELVIKGDETIPEFGGGLCQVSTTLFRSILDAGLPVTSRRNHSYRVPYYEWDGEGNFIGPGLDATIYSSNPDFKFVNDTGAYILIQGYVEEDKATFELYGTSDGRTSSIDGPYTLEESPAGEPLYIETDELPAGETKKIDNAHPGGVAVATYTIEYPDGTLEQQEFKSYYRKWPAKYLVGAEEKSEETSESSGL